MKMVFDIPKVRTLKSKILSLVATKWRQFKSKLTKVYDMVLEKGKVLAPTLVQW